MTSAGVPAVRAPTSPGVIPRSGIAVLSVAIALGSALLLGKGFDTRGGLFLMAIAITVWSTRLALDGS